MARLSFLLPLIVLAGCSQPPAAVNLNAPSAGQPGAQGVPGDAARERCARANWRATGYRHGLSGYPMAALSQVGEACKGTGIEVDRLAYSTGRLEGLGKFCTAENGYRRAKEGRPADNPCPPSLAANYEAGYARGMAGQ